MDQDECADLIVGVPAEDVGTAKDAGTVNVIYGSPAGLGKGKAPSVWVQGKDGFTGAVEAGDRFGESISVIAPSWGPDLSDRLAIGVPGEDLGTAVDAGMMHALTLGGTSATETMAVSQSVEGVDDTAESGDRFGQTVHAFSASAVGQGHDIFRVAVGATGEDSGSGIVQVFPIQSAPGNGDVLLRQGQGDIPAGTPEPGDRFGTAIGESNLTLWIGAPDDTGHTEGIVHGVPMSRFRGGSGTSSTWIPGEDGIPTGGARFGASIA